MLFKQGSSKRQFQKRNIGFVNHITINEDQLPRSRSRLLRLSSMSLDTRVREYPGTYHHKADNDHVHFLVVPKAPTTKCAVKARIAASRALIFDTETGSWMSTCSMRGLAHCKLQEELVIACIILAPSCLFVFQAP